MRHATLTPMNNIIDELKNKLSEKQLAYCEDAIVGVDRALLMKKYGHGAVPNWESDYDVQAYIQHRKNHTKNGMRLAKLSMFEKYLPQAMDTIIDVMLNSDKAADRLAAAKIIVSGELAKELAKGKAQGEKAMGVDGKDKINVIDISQLRRYGE